MAHLDFMADLDFLTEARHQAAQCWCDEDTRHGGNHSRRDTGRGRHKSDGERGEMTTPECCNAWPRYWISFQWMTPEDNTLLMMPYVGGPDVRRRMRINYCPACGADVRDCVVSRERFREVTEDEQ